MQAPTAPADLIDPLIDRLNSGCFCTSLDEAALDAALRAELGTPELAALVRQRCPSAFATRPVFVAAAPLQRIAAVVAAIEQVVALPAYREAVLAEAPAIARADPGGPRGVFLGYDFHVAEGRIGLIEINTNAGGALLNTTLARAQRACCAEVAPLLPMPAQAEAFEARIVAMFQAEWALSPLSGPDRPLRRIALVDEAPEQQYLYPEFLLFQRLFARHGIDTLIADPATLQLREGRLWRGEAVIDLVYNRVTDFALDSPACAALRQAYLAHAVVLTPHPQAHALYADKANLALLSDDQRLQALGVPAATRALLCASIPRTERVWPADAARLWAARRQLFFKPRAGYGSRAAYRGDKLTQRVWHDTILGGDYVAQALMPPGERPLAAGDSAPVLKFDLRAYAYNGAVQWTAARLYQGQTTNFRTPGGGFAPVYSTPNLRALAEAWAAPARAEPGCC